MKSERFDDRGPRSRSPTPKRVSINRRSRVPQVRVHGAFAGRTTAKYRYGECLEKAGRFRAALGTSIEEVRTEYSQTPEAILAGEKLEALRADTAEKTRETNPEPARSPTRRETPLAAGFTLQFGSFNDRANAIKLAAELKRKVSGVRIDSELVNFKEVHRVRSGYFKTRAEAERRAEEIARQTGENCAIMPLP